MTSHIPDLPRCAVVLGLGTEGQAMCRYLRAHGVSVRACDRQTPEALAAVVAELDPLGVEFHLGPDYLARLREADVIYRSPGVPLSLPEVQAAAAAGVSISSQVKLFFDLCPVPIIGVTGTKGKGTTTTLIAEMLRGGWRREAEEQGETGKLGNWETGKLGNQGCKAGAKFPDFLISQFPSETLGTSARVFIGGNIGATPISYVENLTAADVVVLELSSFQLQDLHRSPHVAVVLNVTVDHLNYHGRREEYVAAKQSIVRYQTAGDVAVVNADYPDAARFADLTPARLLAFSRRGPVDRGAYVDGEQLWLNLDGTAQRVCAVEEVLLRGRHNLENVCAALAAAGAMGADLEHLREVLRTFRGLEHRLELVGEIDGVAFYNDSFATTPETAIAALQSFSEPLILIAGGSAKGSDYTELGEEIIRRHVKRLILIGDTAGPIEAAVWAAREGRGEKGREGEQGSKGAREQGSKGAGEQGSKGAREAGTLGTSEGTSEIDVMRGCATMKDALAAATAVAGPGDVVLLSPACASFGLFKDYKDRGNQFKAWVRARMADAG